MSLPDGLEESVFEAMAVTKMDQVERFVAQVPEVAPLVEELQAAGDVSPWVHPTWTTFNAQISATLLPAPTLEFLRDPLVEMTMFVRSGGPWMDTQLGLLRAAHESQLLDRLLAEDPVGRPTLSLLDPVTSHNSIHHLYHLTRFARDTETSWQDAPTVVEWGGGYGNMAKIFQRFVPSSTYVIVDTPVFTSLQWLYLSSVLGPGRVHVWRSAQDTVVPGAINLVALPFVTALDLAADAFLSTWALSESSAYAQEWVARESQWFGAPRVLLAVQDDNGDFPGATHVARLAVEAGGVVHPITHQPGHDYVFRS